MSGCAGKRAVGRFGKVGEARPAHGELDTRHAAAGLDQAKESTAANIVAAAPRADLIHPGALKYLREAGLLK